MQHPLIQKHHLKTYKLLLNQKNMKICLVFIFIPLNEECRFLISTLRRKFVKISTSYSRLYTYKLIY